MNTQNLRWLRIRDLFEQAVEIAPDRRESFLERHCPDDPELRAELRALLDSDQPATYGPLTGAIGDAVSATTQDRRQQLVGTVIGHYRLTQVVGHGGAGTVYLAERADRQYSAQVAIKVVEGAMMNAEVSRRFRSERQILANLNHPNIARLLDAGETEQGFPYLVMEYVHGEPIDKYCDEKKLTVEQRVQLMLKVCSAVQFAHQNLVVHRDIKPANILVKPDGTPKLLDFGIAKLLDTDALKAEAALTRMNDRLLTPEYASPEQILGQPITTSSDVYALGVVTYELLAGFRPYKVSSLSQIELERTICILQPAKPSRALRQAVAQQQLADGKTPLTRPITQFEPLPKSIIEIAASRCVQPQKLIARLGGDLDAILLRALRKEPAYRFESVEQFAADLQRHLNREPVLARQGNWFYYARRFSRRHAAAVGATSAFVLLLVTAVIVTSIQAKRIAEERDRANRQKQTSDAVANFMVDVFAAADPFQAQGRELSAKDLLDKATSNIQANLSQEPEVRAQLLEAMGRTYSRQGQPKRGMHLLEEAIAIRKTLPTTTDADLVPAMLRLAKAKSNADDDKGSEEIHLQVLKILESNKNTHSYEYEITLNRLAAESATLYRDNYQTSIAYHQRGIAAAKDVYGTQHTEYAGALVMYGETLMAAKKLGEAGSYINEGYQLFKKLAPELDPDRLWSERVLAGYLFRIGQMGEAESQIMLTVQRTQQVFGIHSIRTIPALQLHIRISLARENYTEAERLALLLEKSCADALSECSVAGIRLVVGEVLWRAHKIVEAEAKIVKTLDSLVDSGSIRDQLIRLSAEYFLAEFQLARNEPQKALALIRHTHKRLTEVKGSNFVLGRAESTLGYTLWLTGQHEDARKPLENGYQILNQELQLDPYWRKLARQRLIAYYTATGNADLAIAL